MRKKLRLALLRALDRYPRPMRQTTLEDEVAEMILPRPAGAEILGAIESLKADGFLLSVRDAVTEEICWRITLAGQGALADH